MLYPFYLLLVFVNYIVDIARGLRQISNHFINCNVRFIENPFPLFLEHLLWLLHLMIVNNISLPPLFYCDTNAQTSILQDGLFYWWDRTYLDASRRLSSILGSTKIIGRHRWIYFRFITWLSTYMSYVLLAVIQSYFWRRLSLFC